MHLKISTSESNTYRECKKKWYFSYDQLLAPAEPNEHFVFGGAIHAALEAYHGGADHGDVDRLFRTTLYAELPDEMEYEMQEKYDGLDRLGVAMLERYMEWHNNPANISFTVLSLEQEFELPLGVENMWEEYIAVSLVGKVDGIVRDEYGKLFVLEHKTAASITDKYIENLGRNHQIDNYLLGAEALTDGEPISGVIYNILAKSVPEPPKVLKNGTLSKDKRQNTTAQMYRDKIRELSLTEEDYSDILSVLDLQGEPFFRRLKVYRNPDELARARQELLDIARDMRHGLIYRNHSACDYRGCSYHSICIEDTEEARQASFRVKDRKHEELKEEQKCQTDPTS